MQVGFLVSISIINILLGLLVYLNDSKKSINKLFAGLMISAVVWSVGDLLLLYSNSQVLVKIGAVGYLAGPVLVSLFIVLFSLLYLNNTGVSRGKLIIIVLPALVLSFISIASQGLLISEINIMNDQNQVIINRLGYFIYSLYFLVYFQIYTVVLWNRIKKASTELSKKQFKYILASVMSTTLFAFIPNIIIPILYENTSYIWIGPLSASLFALVISISIVRHRLLDVRLIVARSLAYILSLGVLVTVIGGLGALVSSYLSKEFANNNVMSIVLSGLILSLAAVSFTPLKRSFDKITNKFFYRDAYDAQAFLDELNRELVSNIDLESLLIKCSAIIGANLKPEFCIFILEETAYLPQRAIGNAKKDFSDEDITAVRAITAHVKHTLIVADELDEEDELKKLMRKYDIAILARLSTDLELEIEGLGYLLLGAKKSGNPYNKQDLKMIEIISNELVIAIQNALRFEEIEKFNITLQEKVDNATAQLKRTNQKLKELDETKDEFISMASHQLRTPLTSVKGYLSMVLEGDVGQISGPQRKMLEQAFISSQRMVYLIADLLNVSRLKTGKFIIETKPTNLADVVEGEVSQLIDTAKSRDLRLQYKKPEVFPMLMLDETKIRQVIMNFIDNAIYYTPPGGKIEVTLEDLDKTVELRVKDNGIGVPKSERHNLFNKFYRAGNARKARPDGTGLGLFMAKKVIVAQGGAVIFETEEGKGSTFGFTFDKVKLMVEDSEDSEGDAQDSKPKKAVATK